MWIIKQDTLAEEGAKPGANENAVGIKSVDFNDQADVSDWTQFRLLDDDGEVYYVGVIDTVYCSEAKAFSPLDDFGTPNAGCTEMQYFENGEWKTL